MTKLSVNINKIATLRNARGGNTPHVAGIAKDCQRFGAQGITVHPRPDERHITRQDVLDLKPVITTEFNIEGYPSGDFLDLTIAVKADQVTLVPDSPNQLTSNHGWDTRKHLSFLSDIVSRLQENSIRTSIFVDPNPEMVEYAALTKTNRVELYTEPYATLYHSNAERAVAPFVAAANAAKELGMEVNAGHDLNLDNLRFLVQCIPFLKEVSIGHALISDALYFGLETTIQKYLLCLS
ncbi:MAG: pyridoxine 5'-phosphate synthase [Prolixibacteraceae bacterium]|nr:pyridoxine 5'-phosphate synthase [Prolixibacteraceae bacterium]